MMPSIRKNWPLRNSKFKTEYQAIVYLPPEAPGSSTLTRSTFFCRSFTRQGDIYWTPAFHWEMIKGLFSPLDLQHLAGGFKLIREALNATSVFTGRLDQDLTFLSHKRFLLFNGGNQHGVESILQRHLVFTMKR